MKWLEYILRIPRSRGFGVQSPTDYHFLRHVIRQKNPYYAYQDLAPETEHLSKREVEILHFYLRLANYVQDSGEIIILCERPTIETERFQQWERNMELRRKFLKAGSRKAKASITTELPEGIPDGAVLVIENFDRQSIPLDKSSNFSKISTTSTSSKSSKSSRISQILSTRATVVFDLYDLAVAFIHPKRSKATYKVNL